MHYYRWHQKKHRANDLGTAAEDSLVGCGDRRCATPAGSDEATSDTPTGPDGIGSTAYVTPAATLAVLRQYGRLLPARSHGDSSSVDSAETDVDAALSLCSTGCWGLILHTLVIVIVEPSTRYQCTMMEVHAVYTFNIIMCTI